MSIIKNYKLRATPKKSRTMKFDSDTFDVTKKNQMSFKIANDP